jgi:outer membrane protein assembly factor BamB
LWLLSLIWLVRSSVGIVSALIAFSLSAADWPAFRGSNGDGISFEDKAPLHWATNKNVQWKAELPGPGSSSPIVSRSRVFLTCAENAGHKRNFYCFDAQDGNRLWVRSVEFDGNEPTHPSNPYCASTPVANGERVVVWHGSAGVFCYDYDGNQLWKTEVAPVRHDWGYASSPILHQGKVLLNYGPGAQTFLAALDLATGNLLWKYDESGGLDSTDKRMVGSWTTPIIIQVNGKDQVLCSMPTRVIACDPTTGALLWFCTGLGTEKTDLVYASPVVSDGIGVAFTGWVTGPTIGFKLGGAGDVTASNRLWLEKQPQRIGSAVVVGNYLYLVNAGPGIAQCIECRTGKVRWSEPLNGGESWGSVVMVAGRLYVTSRRGVTSVFRPDPLKFELLASNDLGERSNATPAIANGRIYLRTDRHLFCIADQ